MAGSLIDRGLVHTTQDKFECGVFTPKTRQMFSVHTPQYFGEISKRNNQWVCNGFVFEENSGRKITHDHRDVILNFEKFFFQNVFRSHLNAKPSFSNSSGLKRDFGKLRFCDGLVCTVGLTVEIKQRFQIFPMTP